LSYTTRNAYSGLKISNENELLVNCPTQEIKLILSPEIRVRAGSKIVVEQNGFRQAYKNSGESAMYRYHQEIMLERLEKWA
jgi:hypothetical protein